MKKQFTCQGNYHPNTLSNGVLVRSILLFGALAALGFFVVQSSTADEINVWIGTAGNDGIYHLTLDTQTGKLSEPTLAAEVDGAGFLALHPADHVLYSTAKQNNDAGVVALHIDKPRNAKPVLAKLSFLSSGDGGAACVGVDKTGKILMSAQYGGGSTTTYSLQPDGTLGERVQVVEHGKGSGVDPKRQADSHPHWVGTSPDNRFLMVPDLGMDRIVVYELDAETGQLKLHSKVPVPPGSGPRHMKFHTSGKFAYVLNELSLTISVFEYDATTAEFKPIQLIESLTEDLKDKNPNSAAEIRVHPSGKFVYSSNRGHDSISVFSVDQETGKLKFVEREPIRGSWPRNFNLDPSGKWLLAAGARSNTLALFEIDGETGRLEFSQNIVNVPSPICVLFDAGRGSAGSHSAQE